MCITYTIYSRAKLNFKLFYKNTFIKGGIEKMKEIISDYLENFEEETKNRFCILCDLIYEGNFENIDEKLWAKLPTFYVDEKFIRIIPFKDHINIETKSIDSHRNELAGYKITTKGMLQIFHNQQIPCEALKIIFKESFQ